MSAAMAADRPRRRVYRLALGEQEAQTLGYALSLAARAVRAQAAAQRRPERRAVRQDVLREIEALAWKLDRCPLSWEPPG